MCKGQIVFMDEVRNIIFIDLNKLWALIHLLVELLFQFEEDKIVTEYICLISRNYCFAY